VNLRQRTPLPGTPTTPRAADGRKRKGRVNSFKVFARDHRGKGFPISKLSAKWKTFSPAEKAAYKERADVQNKAAAAAQAKGTAQAGDDAAADNNDDDDDEEDDEGEGMEFESAAGAAGSGPPPGALEADFSLFENAIDSPPREESRGVKRKQHAEEGESAAKRRKLVEQFELESRQEQQQQQQQFSVPFGIPSNKSNNSSSSPFLSGIPCPLHTTFRCRHCSGCSLWCRFCWIIRRLGRSRSRRNAFL
jgi:hypothetical protein